jgi:hypothetical protein
MQEISIADITGIAVFREDQIENAKAGAKEGAQR